MDDLVDEVGQILSAFERALGAAIVVYDFTGRLASYLPADKTTHRNPFCRAIMQTDVGVRCGRFDCFVTVPAVLKQKRSGFFKRCHGNVLEYVQGLWSGDELLGAVLFGQFKWPDQLRMPCTTLSPDSFARIDKNTKALYQDLPQISMGTLNDLPLLARALAARLLEVIPSSQPILRSDRRRRWIIEDFLAKKFEFSDTSLEDLAKTLGLSKNRSRHVVKELYGRSFMEILTERRLKHAKYLLGSTNMTVTQLAEYCGYADSHHFHRIFRTATGITPMQYRKQALEKV